MAARTSRWLWLFSAAWFSRCAWIPPPAVRARPPRSSSSNTPCISCHCRRGSRSLRPGLAIRVWLQAEKDGFLVRNAAGGRQIPTNCCSPSAAISPTPHAPGDAGIATVRCIRPSSSASPGAAVASSAPSTTSASASAAPSTAAGAERSPASLRFLGRRVYVAAIVVLIAILKHGATDARLARLSDVASVDHRTIARWRHWWRDASHAADARSGGDRRVPGSCHRSIRDRLPVALIERFTGDGAEPLIALLRFFSPITGGAAMQAR